MISAKIIWTMLQILGALNWTPQHKSPEQLVFQSKEEMSKVWLADGGKTDQLPECYDEIGEMRVYDSKKKSELPKVDFKNHTVLAVFAGEKPNSGHGIKILNVVERKIPENETTIFVIYEETKPAPETQLAAMVVYPFSIVVVKKLTSKIRFVNADTDEAKLIQASLKVAPQASSPARSDRATTK